MTEYRFILHLYTDHVSLEGRESEDDDWEPIMYSFGKEMERVYFTHDEELEFEVFEPSLYFWEAVVEIFSITSNIIESLRRAEQMGVEEYLEIESVPYPRRPPKYEARIAAEVGNWCLSEHNPETYAHYGVLPEPLYEIVKTAHEKINSSDEYGDVEPMVPLVNKNGEIYEE